MQCERAKRQELLNVQARVGWGLLERVELETRLLCESESILGFQNRSCSVTGRAGGATVLVTHSEGKSKLELHALSNAQNASSASYQLASQTYLAIVL